MKTTKHFALAALLVLGALLGPSTTAAALHVGQKTQVKLYPPADNPPFPQASGSVTLSLSRPPAEYWFGSVSVSKLAPNTSYFMPVMAYDLYTNDLVEYQVTFQTD